MLQAPDCYWFAGKAFPLSSLFFFSPRFSRHRTREIGFILSLSVTPGDKVVSAYAFLPILLSVLSSLPDFRCLLSLDLALKVGLVNRSRGKSPYGSVPTRTPLKGFLPLFQ